MKNGHYIEMDKSVASQVSVSTLAAGNPFENTKTQVQLIAPYFKSYAQHSRGDGS